MCVGVQSEPRLKGGNIQDKLSILYDYSNTETLHGHALATERPEGYAFPSVRQRWGRKPADDWHLSTQTGMSWIQVWASLPAWGTISATTWTKGSGCVHPLREKWELFSYTDAVPVCDVAFTDPRFPLTKTPEWHRHPAAPQLTRDEVQLSHFT